MRVFGLLAIIFGMVWVIVSIFLDTSNGSQFNNIGLLFSQFENIVIACFMVLCGIVLFSVSAVIDAVLSGKKSIASGSESAVLEEKEMGVIERKMKSFGNKLTSYEIK